MFTSSTQNPSRSLLVSRNKGETNSDGLPGNVIYVTRELQVPHKTSLLESLQYLNIKDKSRKIEGEEVIPEIKETTIEGSEKTEDSTLTQNPNTKIKPLKNSSYQDWLDYETEFEPQEETIEIEIEETDREKELRLKKEERARRKNDPEFIAAEKARKAEEHRKAKEAEEAKKEASKKKAAATSAERRERERIKKEKIDTYKETEEGKQLINEIDDLEDKIGQLVIDIDTLGKPPARRQKISSENQEIIKVKKSEMIELQKQLEQLTENFNTNALKGGNFHTKSKKMRLKYKKNTKRHNKKHKKLTKKRENFSIIPKKTRKLFS
jgi:hypothetical protein